MIPTDPVPSSSGNAASRIEPQPPASNLALRRVAIDTWRENVAYLHRDCDVYRAEGFQALSKNGGIPLHFDRRSTRNFSTVIKHREVLTHFHHEARVVLDQHDRRAVVRNALDQLAQSNCLGGVQRITDKKFNYMRRSMAWI